MSDWQNEKRLLAMLDLPFAAYMAHPYGGDAINIELARGMATKIARKFPNLVIVNPLDNFLFAHGTDEAKILKAASALLNRCDILILTGNWRESFGCQKELEIARYCGQLRIEMDDSLEIKPVD